MARDAFLDVFLEVPASDMLRMDPERSGQQLLDKLRQQADDEVAKVKGAYLRTDREVPMEVREGQHFITGESTYLISTRWPVVVPDDLFIGA